MIMILSTYKERKNFLQYFFSIKITEIVKEQYHIKFISKEKVIIFDLSWARDIWEPPVVENEKDSLLKKIFLSNEVEFLDEVRKLNNFSYRDSQYASTLLASPYKIIRDLAEKIFEETILIKKEE